MPNVLLFFIAALVVGCALGVVAHRDPVVSALFLTAHLLGVGALFLALTQQFLAVAQVLVYAGAIMVVFIFAVTMLSPKEDPLRFSLQKGYAVTGFVASAILFGCLTMVTYTAGLESRVGLGTPTLKPVQQFALDLFGPYLLPFEGTAFLLLVAFIGAILLGGRRPDSDS